MALMEVQPVDDASTTELLKEAIDETRQLVRIEVKLAREEVTREIKEAKASAIAFGIAAFAALLATATLLAVLVVAIGPIGGLIVGGVLLLAAGIAGAVGYRLVPKKPLGETRKRLERDVHSLKERMA